MDKKLVALFSVFLLVFLSFISVVLLNRNLLIFTRAKMEYKPSASKTIILAWPLETKVNGTSVVTVFVRDKANHPLKNQRVRLDSTLGVVNPLADKTDEKGKIVFNLTSDKPGKALLTVFINNEIKVKQSLSVIFK